MVQGKLQQVATITVVTTCITAEDGSFNPIHQVAPMCTPNLIHDSSGLCKSAPQTV